MQRSVKLLLVLISIWFFVPGDASAASVKCMFLGGNEYSVKDGSWNGSADPMSVMQLFGVGGLTLKISNSLLGKLDSKQPFLAGKHAKGKVYLKGGAAGVEGQVISLKNGIFQTYNGMCTVSFG